MTRIKTIAYIVWIEMLRRKEIYVLLILLGAMLFMLVSLNIFNLGHIVGFVKDAGLLAAWLFGWIITVNCASRQLPIEESRGTILPLLAKPVKRLEIIIGKWLGACLVVSVAVTCFYILTVIILLGYGGHFDLLPLAQALLLHITALSIIAALAIALSTRMNYDAAATLTYVTSATMFLLVPRVPELALHAQGWRQTSLFVLYGFLPHLELFDMRQRVIHQYGILPWNVFGLILLYGLVLVSIMLCFAWLGYHKRHFSRNNQD